MSPTKRSSGSSVNLHVRVTRTQLDQLEEIAEREGKSVTAVLRQVVTGALEVEA